MYNELRHHGILGQKWGVRRYQNPDGSLTEAGKKRYFRKVMKPYSLAKYAPYQFVEKAEKDARQYTEKLVKDTSNIDEYRKSLTKLKDYKSEAKKLLAEKESIDSKDIKSYKSNYEKQGKLYAKTLKVMTEYSNTLLSKIDTNSKGYKEARSFIFDALYNVNLDDLLRR